MTLTTAASPSRTSSPDRESPYNQSLDRDRRSPNRDRRSPDRDRRSPERNLRSSPDQYRRSPERNSSEYYRRKSPERVPTVDYSRLPERREETPKKEERRYGRSSSAESFQTVKIKKSDLNEIRRRYELKFKQKEDSNVIESAKSQAYRYSSNLRNSSEPSSSDGKPSKPSTSSFSRSKSDLRVFVNHTD